MAKQTRAQAATIAILRTADEVRRRLTMVVEAYGITFQQYNVLRILRGAHPEPLRTLEIGDRLIEQVPGVTRLLDRMEQRGWVRRERGAGDRRLVHCWVTDAGLELLDSMEEAVEEAEEEIVASLSADQQEYLVLLLGRVRRLRPGAPAGAR
jgi:DNA-binding MarR family transcriptional regulator